MYMAPPKIYTYCHPLSLPAALPIGRRTTRPSASRKNEAPSKTSSSCPPILFRYMAVIPAVLAPIRFMRSDCLDVQNGEALSTSNTWAPCCAALAGLCSSHVSSQIFRPNFRPPNSNTTASCPEIGTAHFLNPVTNAQLVCRHILEKNN